MTHLTLPHPRYEGYSLHFRVPDEAAETQAKTEFPGQPVEGARHKRREPCRTGDRVLADASMALGRLLFWLESTPDGWGIPGKAVADVRKAAEKIKALWPDRCEPLPEYLLRVLELSIARAEVRHNAGGKS